MHRRHCTTLTARARSPCLRQNLDRLGVVCDRLIAVHMTQLNDEEIARCAEAGVSVVHCPVSNMKLASGAWGPASAHRCGDGSPTDPATPHSGACRVQDLLDRGVNVALGTDGTVRFDTRLALIHSYSPINP